MIKKILITLSILAIIVIAVIIYALSNANSIITKYKPQIEETLSNTLNTKVTLGELDVSIFPKTKIHIDKLELKKNADSKGFILNNFNLVIKLLPVLLEQKLVISELLIDKPNIEFIQTKDGIQIAGLEQTPSSDNKQENKKQEQKPVKEKNKAQASISSPIGLALESFSLVDANIVLNNKTNNTKQHIENLNINSALNFEGDTAILSSLKGSAKLLKQFNLNLNAEKISISLNELLSSIKNLNIDLDKNSININSDINLKSLSGKGLIKINNLEHVAGPINISGGSGSLPFKLNKGSINISTDNLKFLLNQSPIAIKLNADANENNATLNSLFINSFGGTTNLSGNLNLKNSQAFNGNFSVKSISIEDAIKTVMPDLPLTLTGNVEQLNGKINGNLASKDLINSLKGNLSILIKDGELKGSNIAGKVLTSLSEIPFIKGAPLDSLTPEERKIAQSPNTALEALSGDFNLNGSKIDTNNLFLKSTLFDLKGNGFLDLNNDCKFDSDIIFSQAISTSLGKAAKEVRTLLNKEGRLNVPLILRGKLSKLLILPNIEKLIEQGAKAVVKEKANKAIGDFLKKKTGGKLDLFF